MQEQPLISADQQLPELTPKAIFLSILLAAILAASNAYVGLKVGLIVSASIPAAIVAMVVFRFAKESNLLENNIVQTGASASACIASGIVFVTPALLILRFWPAINYWETVFICLTGGILGVLFSIPLRRALLSHPELKFPEGRAIAEVLKANQGDTNLNNLFMAGAVGAFIQFCQQGLQVMTGDYGLWFANRNMIYGIGLGFDITMIGAGYIIGFSVGLSMLIGALVSYIIGVPVISHHFGVPANLHDVADYVATLWKTKIRFFGIGAMLVAGIWSLILCVKPIASSLKFSRPKNNSTVLASNGLLRTERDIPMKYTALGVIALLVMIGWYLFYELSQLHLGLTQISTVSFYVLTLVYILIAGFIFSAITAYFSGLIGMSASPVSAVNIAILILIALLLNGLLAIGSEHHATTDVILHAAAISILVTAILACAGCMSNGTIQDLKTGEILGATPWKLQVILIIGVIVSTLVVPPVIELLYNAYGIGGVFPHPGMIQSQVLGAPQASLIAAVAQGVFFRNLPFSLIFKGAIVTAVFIAANQILKHYGKSLSVVAFAIGIYLPMAVTFPIFVGSLVALFMSFKHKKQQKSGVATENNLEIMRQNTLLIACGLVAGGALMGLCLSIPFAIKGNTEILSIVPDSFLPIAAIISSVATALVCVWMYRVGVKIPKRA